MCGAMLNFDEIKRHPERASGISSVELVCKDSKKGLLQEKLMQQCYARSDKNSLDVLARITKLCR